MLDICDKQFSDTFQIVGTYRGRSKAGLELKSLSTGGTCAFSLSQLMEIIPCINFGKIDGKWKYKKRGANYLIEYLGEAID